MSSSVTRWSSKFRSNKVRRQPVRTEDDLVVVAVHDHLSLTTRPTSHPGYAPTPILVSCRDRVLAQRLIDVDARLLTQCPEQFVVLLGQGVGRQDVAELIVLAVGGHGAAFETEVGDLLP